MLIERLGRVEDSQQVISKRLQDIDRKQFATFISSSRGHCCMDTFFTECGMQVTVECPISFFRSKCHEMIELTLTSSYTNKILTVDLQKDIKELIPNHTSPLYFEERISKGWGYWDITIMFAASQIGFHECCDKNVQVFEYYQGLLRCLKDYAEKVTGVTGMVFNDAHVSKMDVELD
jgi:hypothetical protein